MRPDVKHGQPIENTPRFWDYDTQIEAKTLLSFD